MQQMATLQLLTCSAVYSRFSHFPSVYFFNHYFEAARKEEKKISKDGEREKNINRMKTTKNISRCLQSISA